MEEVRCSEFDAVVGRIREAWEAGLAPPQELLLEAVAVRAKSVAKRARDFTFPMLGQLKFLAGGIETGTHSLSVDLPESRLLNERGFFGSLEVLRVQPSVRGGPIQDDAVVEDVVPGRIVIAGFCPLDRYYVLYSVEYVINDYEKAVTVGLSAHCADAEELIRFQPAVTPMFLLCLMTDGFGTISWRHRRLAVEASNIASAMLHQDNNLARLLEQTPPQSV